MLTKFIKKLLKYLKLLDMLNPRLKFYVAAIIIFSLASKFIKFIKHRSRLSANKKLAERILSDRNAKVFNFDKDILNEQMKADLLTYDVTQIREKLLSGDLTSV